MAMQSSQRPLRMGANLSGLLAEYASIPWDVLRARCIALGYFRMLSPLASSNARPIHAACPAKPHHVLEPYPGQCSPASRGYLVLSSNPACWSPTLQLERAGWHVGWDVRQPHTVWRSHCLLSVGWDFLRFTHW